MSGNWFVQEGEKTYGPLSGSGVKSLASQGTISENAIISKGESGPWHSISKVQGLTFTTPPVEAIAVPPQVAPDPQQMPAIIQGSHPRPTAASQDTETEVWSGTPSQLTNLKTFLLCILFCWLIAPVFIGIWRYLVIRSTRYTVSTQRIGIQFGVIARQRDELEIYRVKDSRITQTVFERIFGLATLAIAASDKSDPVFWFVSIPNKTAEYLKEDIRNRTELLRARKGIREVDYV